MPAKKELAYDVDPETGCFLCTSHAPNSEGYPLVRVGGGVRETAHRLVYRKHKGEIKEGVVRHTCDVRKCINPDHLIDGTQLDNIADREARKRSNHCHPKLSTEDISNVRDDKSHLHKELAAQYDVSRVHITNIKNYKRWKTA